MLHLAIPHPTGIRDSPTQTFATAARHGRLQGSQLELDRFVDSMAEPPQKKRRVDEEENTSKLDDGEEPYVPYVPVKQQRMQRLQKLAAARGSQHEVKAASNAQGEDKLDEEKEEERQRERARRERTLLKEAQEVQKKKAEEDAHKTLEKKVEEEESEMLAAIAARRKLASDLELAKGIQYTESLKTSIFVSGQRKKTLESEKNTTSSSREKMFLPQLRHLQK